MSAITVASCSRCQSQAVIHQRYSGVHLCHHHLEDSIRKRTSKAMREQLKLPKDARKEDGSPRIILVCISGGKDSAVLLDMMIKILGPRRDIELVAGTVDEGIDGYRAPSMVKALELANNYGIRVETISYPELDFSRMDEVVDMMDAKEKSNWSELMQSVGGEIFVTTRLSRPINIHKHQPPYAYVLGEKSV